MEIRKHALTNQQFVDSKKEYSLRCETRISGLYEIPIGFLYKTSIVANLPHSSNYKFNSKVTTIIMFSY